MPSPELSIIIPNYNGADLLPRFLPYTFEAVKNGKITTEILVVDDASSDNSLEVLKAYPQVRVVVREKNGGFSRACNSGLEAAKGRILLFLNSDAALEPDFLAHYESFFNDPMVFGVTPSGFALDSGKVMDGARMGYWKNGSPRTAKNYFESDAERAGLEKPWLSFSVVGAYFFCDAEKMRELGGFDPLFSPYIFEEIDLSYRALKRGWKVVFEPRLRARHEWSTTLKKVARPFRIQRISKRNQLIFVLVNIHSFPMMVSFWFFLLLRLLTFRITHWAAVITLLPRLPRIVRRRKEEKKAVVVSDATLFRQYDYRWVLKGRNQQETG